MELLHFLFFCIATSLWCVGFHRAMSYGGILEWYANLIGRLPEMIAKPLGACLECMASIHGLAWWFVLGYDFSPLTIMAVPIISAFNILIENKLDE